MTGPGGVLGHRSECPFGAIILVVEIKKIKIKIE